MRYFYEISIPTSGNDDREWWTAFKDWLWDNPCKKSSTFPEVLHAAGLRVLNVDGTRMRISPASYAGSTEEVMLAMSDVVQRYLNVREHECPVGFTYATLPRPTPDGMIDLSGCTGGFVNITAHGVEHETSMGRLVAVQEAHAAAGSALDDDDDDDDDAREAGDESTNINEAVATLNSVSWTRIRRALRAATAEVLNNEISDRYSRAASLVFGLPYEDYVNVQRGYVASYTPEYITRLKAGRLFLKKYAFAFAYGASTTQLDGFREEYLAAVK